MLTFTWQRYNALEARFVRASPIRFSDLRTWAIMNFLNPTTRERAKVRYCAIRSFFAVYSPHNGDATNYESHQSSWFMMESFLATCSQSKMASYLTSSLEIANENLTAWVTSKPSGDCKNIPAPPRAALDEPAVSRIHNGLLMS